MSQASPVVNKPSTSNNINSKLNNRINAVESKNIESNESFKSSNDDTSFLKKMNSALDNTTSYLKSFTGSTTTSKNNIPKNNKSKVSEQIITPITYVTDNYIIILGLFIAFIVLVLLYFFSKTFNVGRVKEKMKLYNLYQKISDFDYRQSELGSLSLKDVQVASAYNAANMGSQMLSYTSEHILTQVLKSGARYIELNIFASKFGQDAIPVIDGGFKRGEWKLMLNSTSFEQAIITIAQNAFKPLESEGGAPNSGDPLFLALNLSTGHNIYCLDKVADIIVDYLSDKLLEPKYAYQFNKNIQDIKMNEIQGKVIIFASSGYEGSKLEELINSTWIDETSSATFLSLSNSNITEGFTADELNNIKKSMNKKGKSIQNKKKLSNLNTNASSDKIDELEDKSVKLSEVIKREFGNDLNVKGKRDAENYQDIEIEQPSLDESTYKESSNIIRISAEVFNNPGFDGSRLKNHNKSGLTIVVPHMEGDYLTRNYDPTPAWDLGCQFVAMNYQEIDENMDTYVTHFETKGIIANESNL